MNRKEGFPLEALFKVLKERKYLEGNLTYSLFIRSSVELYLLRASSTLTLVLLIRPNGPNKSAILLHFPMALKGLSFALYPIPYTQSLHLKMEAAWNSKTLVSCHITTWCHIHETEIVIYIYGSSCITWRRIKSCSSYLKTLWWRESELVDIYCFRRARFLISLQSLSQSRNSLHFAQAEDLLPRSQEPASDPYPEPDESISHLPTLFI